MSGVAIITGAAGAIGSAIAERLAASGQPLALVDVSDRVEQVAERLAGEGADVATCVVDIASSGAVDQIRTTANSLGDEIALLVNNAGITRDGRAGTMSAEDFRLVVDINLVTPLLLAEGLGEAMADDGSIVNIASRAALGNFGQANYVTSKSGLIGATRALAIKFAPRLTVNAIAPGLIDTPMTQAMPTDVLERLMSRIPAGRSGSPHDVAAVVAFLASKDAAYITGQLLPVCGGRSIAA